MDIDDKVTIKLSSLEGTVVGVYRYCRYPTRYTVRYCTRDGVVREDAFEAEELTAE